MKDALWFMLSALLGFAIGLWTRPRMSPYPRDRRCENCGRWSRWSTAGCDHCDIEDK